MPSPIVKATLASAALSSASNILAQLLEAYRAGLPLTFDKLQFLRFVVLALITSPPNYKWQQFLEHSFPAYDRQTSVGDIESQHHKEKDEGPLSVYDGEHDATRQKPKLNIRNTMTKWFIDCITIGAILNTVAFYILMGLMKGQTTAKIGQNIRTDTIPLIVAGYKIWPFASIVSFSCIPVEKRIVFLNFVGLLWGIYMSLVAAKV
ncbi:uncharacterized protein BCR38DRAFT_227087 [Pseudomassariella vexata]|uniref:Mpv17/PMP22 family protein n=1 Tax=Pseudomassariella vexata TaxID=1141098 RepID=A0A1Y2DVS0_9PEZI|nr:uncharacterized protein BCR38DRAFT_227087 [Pseudomassariella vexata]ORY63357.1 hypothetical protein BCR38DRAFT_227087 [Pseudomassariella vexata]